MKLLLCAIAGYLLGSISVSILVTKYIFHDDLRQQGSGNAGATNAARVYGLGAGVLTFAGDFAKSILAMLLGRGLGGVMGLAVGGAACLLGHCFPVYFKFKGGKGILCSGTLLLLLDWRIAAVGWGLFLLLWLTTRYVSLGSVTGAFSFPVTTLLFFRGNWTVFALSLAIAALVIWAHRSNIGRLLHGTESRFQWHTNGPGRS